MGRKDDPVWGEFDVVVPKSKPTKPHPDVSCRHCGESIMNAQPSRHLYPHIRICPRASATTKSTWAAYDAQKKRKARPGIFSPSKSRRTSYSGSPATNSPSVLSKEEEASIHLDIAMVFYTAGIPFRAIENAYMRKLFKRLTPALKLPTRQALATTLLVKAYELEKANLAELLSKQTFLVIITDGWSNVNRESIVNYVLWSSAMRPMMWSSGTTGSEAHTGDYMASELLRVIAEVEGVAGTGKVSAVVSDNAANMKKAGRLIEAKHPNVVFNGCSAHAMNLLLKDIFKIKLFGDVLKKATKIVKFVRARHLLLDQVRRYRRQLSKARKAGELAVPVSTRWYAQEKCIKSVVRNKATLKAALANSELMKHYTDKESQAKLDEVHGIVNDKQFWIKAKVVVRLTKPVTRALAVLETDACSNSMILHEFLRLYQAPEYTEGIAALVGSSVQDEIRKLIASRWDFIRPPSDSTTVAYLLDPSKGIFNLPSGSLDGSAGARSSGGSSEGSCLINEALPDPQDSPLRKAVRYAVKLAERFGLPPDVSSTQFRASLLSFVKMKKNWTAVQREAASEDSPLDWWTLDDQFPVLHKFAEKILSIPTSSAASERLWSVQGFTHSKLRNRLKVATVEKLSFIYTNNGDAKPTRLPLYKTPPRPIELDSDSDSDDQEADDSLFDMNDMEFEYLLDAIVSVDISQ